LTCHTTQAKTWLNAPHANSQKVSCESCHGAYVADHPKTQMKVNKSPEVCRECHTTIGMQWQTSVHGQKNLACASCHDPHGATIKVGTAIELCVKCHADHKTTHALSAGKSVSCADCHLSKTVDHSFKVSGAACVDCHAKQMHQPIKSGAATAPNAEVPPPATTASGGIPLASSVAGIIVMGAVIGLAWRRFTSK
jgi:predicted CXXCH cytochrome family protein